MVRQAVIELESKGGGAMADITEEVASAAAESGMTDGIVTVFVPGATGGVTTIEHEGGLVKDFGELMERLAPRGAEYAHNERWGDGNGHSHVRASLLGPSLTVPLSGGRLTLGTWQQIVFVDFDVRRRSRRLIVQMVGE
ncbi:MAG: secondary thiamine-phosphate synthase enzyme YjbQ [bacterium]